MPTNSKEYMNNYMKKYNMNEKAKLYYQKNKNNPNSSCYLPHRMILSKQYYREKIKRPPRRYIYHKDIKFKLNYGSFTIIFE